MTYSKQCEDGCNHAARVIEDCAASGNVPRLVQEIRGMASDQTGFGVGFLSTLSEMVLNSTASRL